MSAERAEDRYDNPEQKRKLDEAREKLQREQQKEQAEQAAGSKTARNIVASEDQPGMDDLPQPEGKTVEWRGKELEFDEMGESLVEIVKMEEEGKQAEMMSYVVDMLGEKCRHQAAGRDYWRRFDLMRDDDIDGLMDLFKELTGGDLDPEQQEKIEEFRSG